MATIVREEPNYAANALVNFLGPLISNAIAQQQQRDYNRKMNAYRGAVMDEIANMTLPPAPQQDAGYLAGGSTNNWENAFRHGGNELANFDANTAGMTGKAPQPVTWPTQRELTLTDLQNLMNRTAASKRFGMLNPGDIQTIMKPTLDAYEQARQRRIQEELADAVLKAKDGTERRDLATAGAIRGIIPESLANSIHNQYIADRVQPYTQDLGGVIERGVYNPVTGEYIKGDTLERTLTPGQVVENNRAIRQFNYMQDKDAREFAEGKRRFDTQTGLTREEIAARNKPQYGMQAINGKLYWVGSNGEEPRPVIIDGQHANAPQGVSDLKFNDVEKEIVSQINKDIEGLTKRRDDLQKKLWETQNSEEKERYSEEIKRIDSDIGQQKAKLSNFLKSKMTPPVRSSSYSSNLPNKTSQSLSLGTLMIGNANKGQVSNHGNFGYQRSDGHIHGGTDFPAPEGTSIRIPAEIGGNLKVVKVCTNPNDPSNYGCHVRLEGIVGGKKYGFILAHMKKGSIQVNVGDVLKAGNFVGEVGSTGRSTGPHLHLEIKEGGLNGKKIDPEKFLSRFQNEYSSVPPVAGGVSTVPVRSAVQDNSPLVMSKPDGTSLTQTQLDTFMERVEAGKVQGIRTREEGLKYLEREGYKSLDTVSNDVSAMPPVSSADQTPTVNMPQTPSASSGTSSTEQRGIAHLNGSRTTSPDVTPENSDVDTASSPEKYAAPVYTDTINGTTEDDMQKYLDALNGYERGELTELDIWELNRKYQNSPFWSKFNPTYTQIMKYGSGVDSESTPFFRRETGRWRPIIM